MFSQEEIRNLSNYLQTIIERPRPIQEQIHVIRDGFIWCEDWRIIEILKYFINGHDAYIGDPPPNRLKRNPLWSKDEIIAQAQEMRRQLQTVEAIVEFFKHQREKEYAAAGT